VNDAFAANTAWGELFEEGNGPLTLGAMTGDVSQMNLSNIHTLNLTKLSTTDSSMLLVVVSGFLISRCSDDTRKKRERREGQE
jgi:hypothetical protein